MQEVTIQFKGEIIEQAKDKIKQFLKTSEAAFEFVFLNDNFLVVINEEKEKNITFDDLRMLAGNIARAVNKKNIDRATIKYEALVSAFSTLDEEGVLTSFVEGWELGLYRYEKYKSKKKNKITDLHIEAKNDLSLIINESKLRAEAVKFSRDLMNEAPQDLTPKTFPKRLQEAFKNTDVDVMIYDKEAIEKLNMNGILTVNRGSKHEPAFVELRYEKDASKPLVSLVGKGVTFDTGGISLKSGRNLSDMRMDMGGAAAVAGALKLLDATKADVNVVVLIQIVENMPDQQSLLPGEVIEYKTGQTVQVGNTDAEGRLILADGLIRSGELEADYIVNIATLTGAIHAALGSNIAGVFGDDELARLMKEIGEENGDFAWPMPLIDAYESYLKSDYADFCNISNKGEAGAITAALFLRKFVPDEAKWLHIDMAGVMERTESGYYTNGGSGYGVRLLADFVKAVSK